MQMYEKAAPFFDLAAQVEPQEVKWQLMVASCLRRTANHQQVSQLCRVQEVTRLYSACSVLPARANVTGAC